MTGKAKKKTTKTTKKSTKKTSIKAKAKAKPKAKAKKVKVSTLAKEIGKTTKELLAILSDLKIPAKSGVSPIEEESVKIIKELLAPPPEKGKEQPKEEIVEKISPPKEEIPPKIEEKPEIKRIQKPVKEEKKPKALEKAAPLVVIETPEILIKELAEMFKVKSSLIIKELMKKGILANINQSIPSETAKEIGDLIGKEVQISIKEAKKEEKIKIKVEARPEELVQRPPVVTIMGHVDHGKTKLLDAVRQTKVVEKEAGGITQHIGAYQVEIKGRKITFLDTPGHEAFTALRARGAKVTDIAVLVVAADDGVKPQTIEAVDHAKAAKVPIIVAINKVDKPESNPERVKTQLSDLGLIPEEWGGQTVTCQISAKEKTGIDDLLEMILLVADLQEIKANPFAKAKGIVIESRLDKSRGPVATVLIKEGTLRAGEIFSVGGTSGRVRALVNEFGERIKEAPPATPAEILGISEVPTPGDILEVFDSEKKARELAERNKLQKTRPSIRPKRTLEEFSLHVKDGEKQILNLIIKADVQGSLEALINSLSGLKVGNVGVNIIHSQVGTINESDVILAEASDAVIVGFHTKIEPRAKQLAEQEEIDVRIYDIIYKVVDDIKLALEGLLKPVFEEVLIGKAEVRQTFSFSKIGIIAGCFVNSGKLKRGTIIKVFRGDEKIFEGKLETLKRFKEDVKEVDQGYECGVSIPKYSNFQIGDKIECFEKQKRQTAKQK